MAFSTVKHHLESLLGNDPESPSNTWYDWFVTGGGRWSTSEDQYDDNYMDDVVDQDSPKFQEYLDKAKEYRQTSLNEYIEEARKIDLDKIISNIEASTGDDFHSALQLFSLYKLYDMSMGTWDYNSYYFDIMNDSANTIHMLRSIENGAKDWFLVPCDMHY